MWWSAALEVIAQNIVWLMERSAERLWCNVLIPEDSRIKHCVGANSRMELIAVFTAKCCNRPVVERTIEITAVSPKRRLNLGSVTSWVSWKRFFLIDRVCHHFLVYGRMSRYAGKESPASFLSCQDSRQAEGVNYSWLIHFKVMKNFGVMKKIAWTDKIIF